MKIKKAAEFLKNNNCFCFLCHKNLDGDTLGASYSLHYALNQLNKKSIVKTVGKEPFENFKSLLKIEQKEEDFLIEHYVTVDVASLTLLEQNFNQKISLSVDHHKSFNINCNLKCVDEFAAASCEIVYLILKELEVKITKQIANCLYLGISTDTGCFKFSNTTAKTHKIAAELIEKGADFSKINYYMFDRKTKERLKLEKSVLENLEYYFNDLVALVFITNEIIFSTKSLKEDLNSIAHIAYSFKDAVFSVTAKQEQEGFKISVRTKNNWDAGLFCEKFGGGGHKNAAGCFIKGNLKLVKARLLAALKEELKF